MKAASATVSPADIVSEFVKRMFIRFFYHVRSIIAFPIAPNIRFTASRKTGVFIPSTYAVDVIVIHHSTDAFFL